NDVAIKTLGLRASTETAAYPNLRCADGLSGVMSVHAPVRVSSFQTAPSSIGMGPGSVPKVTKRLPSEDSTAWLGRYLVGCPGMTFQVLPPSSLRSRPGLPMTDTPANSVWLGLPATPLRGSKTTNT